MGILSDRQIKSEVKITPLSDRQQADGKVSFGLSSYGYDVRCGYRFKVFSNVFCGVVDPKRFDEKAFVDVDVSRVPHELVEHTHAEILRCVRCDRVGDSRMAELQCGEWKPEHVLIPPNSFALAETVEHLKVPRDCLALVIGKSTYARCGIVLNCTPLEPEWEGKVTLEISNTTPLPAKVYAGEGIGQVMFFRSDERAEALEEVVKMIAYYADEIPDSPQAVREKLEHVLRERLNDKASCETSYADRKGIYQNQGGLTLPKVRPKLGNQP